MPPRQNPNAHARARQGPKHGQTRDALVSLAIVFQDVLSALRTAHDPESSIDRWWDQVPPSQAVKTIQAKAAEMLRTHPTLPQSQSILRIHLEDWKKTAQRRWYNLRLAFRVLEMVNAGKRKEDRKTLYSVEETELCNIIQDERNAFSHPKIKGIMSAFSVIGRASTSSDKMTLDRVGNLQRLETHNPTKNDAIAKLIKELKKRDKNDSSKRAAPVWIYFAIAAAGVQFIDQELDKYRQLPQLATKQKQTLVRVALRSILAMLYTKWVFRGPEICGISALDILEPIQGSDVMMPLVCRAMAMAEGDSNNLPPPAASVIWYYKGKGVKAFAPTTHQVLPEYVSGLSFEHMFVKCMTLVLMLVPDYFDPKTNPHMHIFRSFGQNGGMGDVSTSVINSWLKSPPYPPFANVVTTAGKAGKSTTMWVGGASVYSARVGIAGQAAQYLTSDETEFPGMGAYLRSMFGHAVQSDQVHKYAKTEGLILAQHP